MDLIKSTLSRKGGDTAEKVSVKLRQQAPSSKDQDLIAAPLMQLDVTQKRTKLVPGSSDGQLLLSARAR